MPEDTPANRERADELVRKGPIWMAKRIMELEDAKSKLYVLETGCYENRGIHGVFSNAEAAMAAWPGSWSHYTRDWVHWSNDLDWDDAASIVEYVLDHPAFAREP